MKSSSLKGGQNPISRTKSICEHCLGAFLKSELWKHVRLCIEKPPKQSGHRGIQAKAHMFYFTSPTACATLKNYMSHMRVDEASQHVNKDWLIIEFGNKLCLKLRMDGDHQHYVSNKVRELARLVLETSKCCESVSLLEHCFLPKHFDFLVEAAT